MGILSRLRDHDDQDSCGGMWASGRWTAETAREVSSTTVDRDGVVESIGGKDSLENLGKGEALLESSPPPHRITAVPWNVGRLPSGD